MIIPTSWKKSSFSGGGEGNDCVEVADLDTHIAIRDSKAPARATLTVPVGAFAHFIRDLKATHTTKSNLTPR
ncbi:uncharacterized protein DUF397 [Streptomyces puniciscabiei]|uniref:Uncharacterized protein DUF397 n=1 Tax=Streptomyces puniciscabiei TaxID=164348 RepID=A0A542UIG5_9ACTN|nr:DUF397 domain-containing protein [Streptomyces puniciscabiei]TQK98875.1 uncharacterized protein DUF397 [Streptomyces puniciscabiei]